MNELREFILKDLKIYLMTSLKMQRTINHKLNGLKERGLAYRPEKGKDKRGITGFDTKKLLEYF